MVHDSDTPIAKSLEATTRPTRAQRPTRGDPSAFFYVSCATALAGVVGQLQQTALLDPWAYRGGAVAACVMFGLYLASVRRGSQLLCLGLACLALGFSWAGLSATSVARQQLAPELEGVPLVLTGTVDAMVQPTPYGIRFRFRVDQPPPGVPPLVMLAWRGGAQVQEGGSWQLQPAAPSLQPGDVWRMAVKLKALHGTHNPGGFDVELWGWEQGLGATGSVSAAGAKEAQRMARTWSRPLERLRQVLRDRLLAHFNATAYVVANTPDALETQGNGLAGARWAGVLAALVVGDQQAIHPADWDTFRATGVAHLVSISGLHITMFAWAAVWAVAWVWRRRPSLCLWLPVPLASALVGVGLATLYALLSGWGLPAQRTVWMLWAVVLLRLLGRQWPWPRVWCLALMVVVATDPWAVLAPGFWLSFVAVGALLASESGSIAPMVQEAPTSYAVQEQNDPLHPVDAAWRPSIGAGARRAWLALFSLLREQWLITLALAPLTVLLFQQVSLAGLLANVGAVPWMTLVVTPLAMVGVLLPAAWDVAAWCLQLQMGALGYMAQWPFATVGVASAPLWLAWPATVGAVVLILPVAWPVRALGLPLVMAVLLWQAPRPPVGHFEVVFADIGQGNAVLVKTHTHTLVYDTGPSYSAESDAGQRIVAPLLRTTAEQPDLLIVSHQDNDHSGGAQSLLRAYPHIAYLSSAPPTHSSAQGRAPVPCRGGGQAGQSWQWDGVQFDILHPSAQDYETQRPSNAMSCVLRITNGLHTVLLVADIEADQEARLLQEQPQQLRADVLLVPHHGSKTSSTGLFLEAVRPRFAVVQAGYRNRYGHPAPRVVQRYTVRGITLIDSPHCGAATWTSANPAQFECSRQSHARYWHHQIAPVGALVPAIDPN